MEYKLIKKYPSLPKDWEVGMIIGQGDRGTYGDFSPCDSKYRNSYIICLDVINYPEFWQPLIKKDYEILSINHNGNIIKYDYNMELVYSIWKIHSVKRLSDSAIFTISDKITSSSFSKLSDIDKIKEFYIPDEKFCKMWNNQFTINDLIIRTTRSWQSNLHHAIKVKQKLFTSEDGIDIFEGDPYHTYNLKLDILSQCDSACPKRSGKNIDTKYFSTKEKAEEHILLNKPCLSINDLSNIKKKYQCFGDTIIEEAKNIVKSKIQQSVYD